MHTLWGHPEASFSDRVYIINLFRAQEAKAVDQSVVNQAEEGKVAASVVGEGETWVELYPKTCQVLSLV